MRWTLRGVPVHIAGCAVVPFQPAPADEASAGGVEKRRVHCLLGCVGGGRGSFQGGLFRSGGPSSLGFPEFPLDLADLHIEGDFLCSGRWFRGYGFDRGVGRRGRGPGRDLGNARGNLRCCSGCHRLYSRSFRRASGRGRALGWRENLRDRERFHRWERSRVWFERGSGRQGVLGLRGCGRGLLGDAPGGMPPPHDQNEHQQGHDHHQEQDEQPPPAGGWRL